MAVNETFFIRLRGRVEGPFTPEKLRELATRGRFARHYEVSPDGLNWSLASGYPGLFPVPTQRKIRASGLGQSPIAAGRTVVERTPGGVGGGEPFFLEGSGAEAEQSQAETLWHYAQGNNSCGPVPFSELLRLAMAGQLQPSDLIWTEGMPEWTAADAAAPGLFEAAFDSSGNMLGPGAGKTSRLAIASLTLGLLGMNVLLLVGSIAAIILGHMSLKQIDRSRGRLGGRGLAVFGTVLGYVTIGAAIVAAIAFIIVKFAVQTKDSSP